MESMKPKYVDGDMGVTIEDISLTELNLAKTLRVGQSFRWAYDSRSGIWYNSIGDKVAKLRQVEYVTQPGMSKIETNFNMDEIKVLEDYLDLTTSYSSMFDGMEKMAYEERICEEGSGTHILKQNLLETMVSFLISQRNSMYNITNVVNKLCRHCGELLSLELKGKVYDYYAFPTLEQLHKVTYEEAINMSMGYRAGYFIRMIDVLYNKQSILDELKRMDADAALERLMKFKGIGKKVANCIALFSLHHLNLFPIDVHIQEVIDREYGGRLDTKRFGGFAGVMQQYMFSSET